MTIAFFWALKDFGRLHVVAVENRRAPSKGGGKLLRRGKKILPLFAF